jgi:sulfhydrogenase subunit beta (sulfur reductase)
MAGVSRHLAVVSRADLNDLLIVLSERGYSLIGPTVRDGAIVYEPIRSTEDLPAGWSDEQEPGSYRLRRRDDRSLFGFNLGPDSWKKHLFPPRVRLWRTRLTVEGLGFDEDDEPVPRYAFVGVRACELAGIRILDRVLLDGTYRDPVYRARRENAFILAVNCAQAASTCFCTSMHTGPRVDGSFDLSMTELIDGESHEFLVEIGSALGREVLEEIPRRPAAPRDLEHAHRVVSEAERQIEKNLDTAGLAEALLENPEHPRWDDAAERCMACSNCTMVCPTCFCSTIEDSGDLSGETAERWRAWDSCTTQEFGFIHGGSVRQSRRSRYRQWVTHKFAGWTEQFGSHGCVGCGRCITWCPVGIDITEEASAVRDTPAEPVPSHG